MHPRLLAYAERQAPRFTSYPTAPHFNARVNGATMRDWLGQLDHDAVLSLYMHVPYCHQLCWYCGCNTYAARRDAPIADFAAMLMREMALIEATLGHGRFTELHWGGGTPNILSAEAFTALITAARRHFDLSGLQQHAIELDPRHLDAAKAGAYAAAGVNRASLGVQSFDARVQNAIGRVQPFAVVARAVESLRAHGIADLSIDLMYGLPHQSIKSVRDSVRLAASLRPQRLALFGYAHVPWFKKRQRLIPEAALPGAAERFDQADAARAELEAEGYVAIGMDHFALPSDELARAQKEGRLGRSFQGYVARGPDAVIGLGPSAISTLPQGYAQNEAQPGAWSQKIAGGDLATARGHMLSAEDRVRRTLIEEIMCDFTADLAPLGGAGACADALEALAPMMADQLVRVVDDRLVLSPEARPLCRVIGAAFDLYAREARSRHAAAV